MEAAPLNGDSPGGRILEEASEIAYPRYPGTDGDRRVIETLAERLDSAGLVVEKQPFSYDISKAERTLRAALIVGGLCVAASGLATATSPFLGLVLLIAALLPSAFLLAWSPSLEALYRREGETRTANVWGQNHPEKTPAATLIFMAHHDSKSQSLTFPFRMGLTVLAIAGVLVLLATIVSGLIRLGSTMPQWTPMVSGLAAAGAALVLSTMRSGNRSPGGVDNAGSVAIVLELARTLPAEVSPEVELVFLSTGAEEDHMVGAMRWLDAQGHRFEDRPVYCLNFDGAGAPGRTVLIERFGFGRLFSKTMSDAARSAATRLGIPVRGIVMLPAMGIDAIPFAHKGIPCLTFSSGSLGRATMSVHSANDRAEHLDAETLGRISKLASETARELIALHHPPGRNEGEKVRR
jgi:hypothetical protein